MLFIRKTINGVNEDAMKTSKVNNPATNPVGLDDVKIGDVFLSRSWGTLSDAICLLDGGDYSHSAICVEIDPDGMPMIVEATKDGVVASRLEDSLAVKRYIDLYRFKSDTNETFQSPNWPPGPVITRAEDYKKNGTKYAYSQLLLMGILVLVRRAPVGKLGQAKIRYWLAKFVEHFKAYATGKKEEVTCSELIYRCFYEAIATPPAKYGLTIRGALGPGGALIQMLSTKATPAQIGLDPKTAAIVDEAVQVLLRLRPQFNSYLTSAMKAGKGVHIMAANPNVCADMVTPYDLQKSPNLIKVGEFKRKPIISWVKHIIKWLFKSSNRI